MYKLIIKNEQQIRTDYKTPSTIVSLGNNSLGNVRQLIDYIDFSSIKKHLLEGNLFSFIRYTNSHHNKDDFDEKIDLNPSSQLYMIQELTDGSDSIWVQSSNAYETMTALSSGVMNISSFSKKLLTEHLLSLQIAAALALSREEYASYLYATKDNKDSFLNPKSFTPEIERYLEYLNKSSYLFWKDFYNSKKTFIDDYIIRPNCSFEKFCESIPYLSSDESFDRMKSTIEKGRFDGENYETSEGARIEFVSHSLIREAYLGTKMRTIPNLSIDAAIEVLDKDEMNRPADEQIFVRKMSKVVSNNGKVIISRPKEENISIYSN